MTSSPSQLFSQEYESFVMEDFMKPDKPKSDIRRNDANYLIWAIQNLIESGADFIALSAN